MIIKYSPNEFRIDFGPDSLSVNKASGIKNKSQICLGKVLHWESSKSDLSEQDRFLELERFQHFDDTVK